jgi:hypothetical protein
MLSASIKTLHIVQGRLRSYLKGCGNRREQAANFPVEKSKIRSWRSFRQLAKGQKPCILRGLKMVLQKNRYLLFIIASEAGVNARYYRKLI